MIYVQAMCIGWHQDRFNLSKVPFDVALPFPRSLDADGRLTAKYIAP
jgi:hypothetical protein